MINQSNFMIHVYFWKKIIQRLLFSNFLNSVNLLRTFITAILNMVLESPVLQLGQLPLSPSGFPQTLQKEFP